MKIGSTSQKDTGKTASRKGHPDDPLPQEQVSLPSAESDNNPRQQLAVLADSARQNLIDKAGLQSSLNHKLLASRNRANEIRERIQSGYYGRPDIIRTIADRLATYIEP